VAGSARAVSASRFVVAGKGERAPGLSVADSMGAWGPCRCAVAEVMVTHGGTGFVNPAPAAIV
jgi:hypothetical protein